MRSRHSLLKSSFAVSIPAIAAEGILCLLAAFYGFSSIAFFLAPLFLISLVSRIWASIASNSLEASIEVPLKEVFPGQDMEVNIDIRNRSFIPVAWVNIFMPLPVNLSLMPDEVRAPDSTEAFYLINKGLSSKYVGSCKCGRLLWYEDAKFTVTMEAKNRGLFSFAEWSLNTGDGFGLSESSVPIANAGMAVVFPRIVDVDLAPFMKNLWNSNTGSRGVMADMSVIRSTRDYQSTDNLKHINWRLLARALPLKVNTYEDILPKSIHILLDGESFSGPSAHPEEMENAISTIASVLTGLQEHDMKCYLSICRGADHYPLCITPEDGVKEALYALACYAPLPQMLDRDGVFVVRQSSLFDSDSVIRSSLAVGHFFYFCYDRKDVASALLSQLEESRVTIISCIDSGSEDMYHHILLKQIMRGE